MKSILIDNIQDKFGSNSARFIVEVDGQKMQGSQFAKPLNYDPKYFTREERQEMAIAVCFFEDLSNKEQAEYVKSKIKKDSDLCDQLLD